MAVPLTLVIITRWVEGFAYKAAVPWWLFLVAGAVVEEREAPPALERVHPVKMYPLLGAAVRVISPPACALGTDLVTVPLVAVMVGVKTLTKTGCTVTFASGTMKLDGFVAAGVAIPPAETLQLLNSHPVAGVAVIVTRSPALAFWEALVPVLVVTVPVPELFAPAETVIVRST